jgi:hypothetical protein
MRAGGGVIRSCAPCTLSEHDESILPLRATAAAEVLVFDLD